MTLATNRIKVNHAIKGTVALTICENEADVFLIYT